LQKEFRESDVRTDWDDLGWFRLGDVPILFPHLSRKDNDNKVVRQFRWRLVTSFPLYQLTFRPTLLASSEDALEGGFQRLSHRFTQPDRTLGSGNADEKRGQQ